MVMPLATPYPPPAQVAAAVARALAVAHDRPHPIEDANRSPEKYARLAQDFRASAREHLNRGDLPQASNKAWGMVAETVKAVSAQHGAFIHTHRAVLMAAGELAELAARAGDPDTRNFIHNALSIARNLHGNFYEDELSAPQVTANLEQCEMLAEQLLALFGTA